MGLCGGYRCGCGLTSTPATSGEINGELPTINVSGSGEPGDPYDIGFSDAWAFWVAEGIKRDRVYYSWRRDLFQSIPNNILTVINPDVGVGSAPAVDWTPGGSVVTIPTGLYGVYLMTGHVTYETSVLGVNLMQFRINGGDKYFPFASPQGSNNQAGTIATVLSDGDTVELQTNHNNGGAVNVTATFELYRLPDDNPFYGGP